MTVFHFFVLLCNHRVLLPGTEAELFQHTDLKVKEELYSKKQHDSKNKKGKKKGGGYLVSQRGVLLIEGLDLLSQPAVHGSPATLPALQLLLQGAQLLLQRLAGRTRVRLKGSSTDFRILHMVSYSHITEMI